MKTFLQFLLETEITVKYLTNIYGGHYLPPENFYDLSSNLYIPSINTILSFAHSGHKHFAKLIKSGKNVCNEKIINETIQKLYKPEYKDLGYEQMFVKMGLIRFSIPKTYDLLISAEYNKIADVSNLINFICNQVIITTIALEMYNVNGKQIYVIKEFENGRHIPNNVDELKSFIQKHGREARF